MTLTHSRQCARARANANKDTDEGYRVFQLKPGLSPMMLQEAICHRLEMLSAVVDIISKTDIAPTDARQLKCYGWAMSAMVDDLKELFYSAWEKSQAECHE